MKSLLYADWCVLKEGLRRYLAGCALMCLILCHTGVADEPNATAAAAYVQQTCVVTTIMMMTMMCFFGLFGADERVGWESARLALPVSRRTVVAARYVFLIVLLAVMAVAGCAVGTVAGAVLSAVLYGSPAARIGGETLLLLGTSMLAVLLFASLEMPFFFWKGLAKARVAFSLPLLLIPLISIDSLRTNASQLVSYASSIASPAALLALGTVLVALFAFVSLKISQRLYRTRDF